MTLKLNNFILAHTALFFWVALIGTNFALFTPSMGQKGDIYSLDIIIHYIMFMVFAGSAFLHFRNRDARTLAILAAFAVFVPLSELIQETIIPGRGYEFTDILSGVAGVLSGFLVFKKLDSNTNNGI